MKPDWYPEWAGQTVVIVASGPSAKDAPVELARGRARVIAVNDSWLLAPWADLLFAGDYGWWHRWRGCRDFAGLKVSTDRRACEEWGINRLFCSRADDRIQFDLGRVGWAANSGFKAFNLAAQLAPAKILLVGFDMTARHGLHWHGPHPAPMMNPKPDKIIRWRRTMDAAAAPVAARGIQVVNCSPVSALKRYEKMGLAEALAA